MRLAVGRLLLAAVLSVACSETTKAPDSGPGEGEAPNPITSVRLTPDTLTLETDQDTVLVATARTRSGTIASGTVFAWQSSDTTVLRVTSSGRVTGVAAGSAVVNISAEGASGQAHVTVRKGLGVVRIENPAGYSSLLQANIPLRQGVTYLLSVAISGRVTLSDDVYLGLLAPFSINGVRGELQATDVKLRAAGVWTYKEGRFTVPQDGLYSPLIALQPPRNPMLTDVRLAGPDSVNLIRNGRLEKGLARWTYGVPSRWFPSVYRALQSPVTSPPPPTRDTSRQLRCTSGRGAALPPATVLDGRRVRYRGFFGAWENVTVYEDSLITLMVPDTTSASSTEVREIACRLNQSWLYYLNATGRAPAPRVTMLEVDGTTVPYQRPVLAVVLSTCGAGCGFIGTTGIEVGRGIWSETVANYRAGMETRAVFEYEMGRNFWLFGRELHSPLPAEQSYHLATAFATIMGHLAGVAAGAPTSRGNENVEWLQTFREGFQYYVADPDFTDLIQGGSLGEKIHGGVWLHLHDKYGPGFLGRFFRAVTQQPAAVNRDAAALNFVRAASSAAGEDLAPWFRSALKYPVP